MEPVMSEAPEAAAENAVPFRSWDEEIKQLCASIEKNRGFSYFKVTGPPSSGKTTTVAARAAKATMNLKKGALFAVPTLMEAEFISTSSNAQNLDSVTFSWSDFLWGEDSQALEEMLRKGTTLIVKLNGQRTLASDLAQAAIYQLIEQERQNPDWAFTLVVLASFDIPCYHVLGNLDLPCTVLGHDLEDPKSVEQALSSRCYNLDPQIDWDAYVEQLIMDADRQQDPSTIICFLPLNSLNNSVHLAFSRNWKVCNTRTLHYQAEFLKWYRYETSPMASCALVVLDQVSDITACSVDLPNIRDIVLARSTRKLMFDPVMGQVMENDAQKPEDVALHCNFNLDEALCTAPWNPNPTTEQKSAFEWFYACSPKWPDIPVREWPVSFPYDRTLADSVASQLLWLEVIEPGDKTASFRIKTGFVGLP
ncbi:Putative P-loop containing nucleoside triphosphate hydrolase [Colletotrichum destructivum]|uniref:P-loop containing nucleoside triphosphate hydrolase n=1 Tax=Colletotrichum destructivum TaxID=34406 RepID=A0AAX4I9B3_9PEZI|nr:Putative P-loop containing nucleoside triphosphate hydrolase [Colletotrichum destructivum]